MFCDGRELVYATITHTISSDRRSERWRRRRLGPSSRTRSRSFARNCERKNAASLDSREIGGPREAALFRPNRLRGARPGRPSRRAGGVGGGRSRRPDRQGIASLDLDLRSRDESAAVRDPDDRPGVRATRGESGPERSAATSRLRRWPRRSASWRRQASYAGNLVRRLRDWAIDAPRAASRSISKAWSGKPWSCSTSRSEKAGVRLRIEPLPKPLRGLGRPGSACSK